MEISNGNKGFVLVIALIVLLVATVVGIFAIQNTAIDTKISGNERVSTLMFNSSDAGAGAGVSYYKSNKSSHNWGTAPWGVNDGGDENYFSSNIPLTANTSSPALTSYNFTIVYTTSGVSAKKSLPPPGYDLAASSGPWQGTYGGSKQYITQYYVIKGRGYASNTSNLNNPHKEVNIELSDVRPSK